MTSSTWILWSLFFSGFRHDETKETTNLLEDLFPHHTMGPNNNQHIGSRNHAFLWHMVFQWSKRTGRNPCSFGSWWIWHRQNRHQEIYLHGFLSKKVCRFLFGRYDSKTLTSIPNCCILLMVQKSGQPVDVVDIAVFIGLCTSKVVVLEFLNHQQYLYCSL